MVSKKIRKFVQRVLGVAVGVVIALMTVNLGARFLEPTPTKLELPGTDIDWLVRDAYLGWANVPNLTGRFATDGAGHRIVPTHGSGPTVLCLGDSGTFGIWRGEQSTNFDSFPELLARKGNVLNFGCLGYTSWHVLRQLREDAGSSQIVVIRIGWNDHNNQHTMKLPKLNTEAAFWMSRVAAGRMLLLGLTEKADSMEPIVSKEQLAQNIADICALAQRYHQRVFFLDYPIGNEVKDPKLHLLVHYGRAQSFEEIVSIHSAWMAIVKQVSTDCGATFLQTGLDDTCFDANDPIHPNTEGCRRIAAAVAQALDDESAH